MFCNDVSRNVDKKQTNAISHVPDAQALMKKLVKVFRTSRAPYDSSHFCQMRLETRMS